MQAMQSHHMWKILMPAMPRICIPNALVTTPSHLLQSVEQVSSNEKDESRSSDEDAIMELQLRSLNAAVEEAAAELARREAARRRPAGAFVLDEGLHVPHGSGANLGVKLDLPPSCKNTQPAVYVVCCTCLNKLHAVQAPQAKHWRR